MRTVGGLSFTVEHPEFIIQRNGASHYHARYITYRGKRYTAKAFADFIRNEIFRKGTRPILRTTSPRFRAGTRRTKRLARATG